MNTGSLRHEIQIQTATETQDASGHPARSFSTVATVWASVQPLRGREYFEAQRVDATITHKVNMRFYDGTLTPDERIVFGSREFNIVVVRNLNERNVEMELLVTEAV